MNKIYFDPILARVDKILGGIEEYKWNITNYPERLGLKVKNSWCSKTNDQISDDLHFEFDGEKYSIRLRYREAKWFHFEITS